VVASLPRLRGCVCFICLNPLHCGAVVASAVVSALFEVSPQVLIPFIAGQWSLREKGNEDNELLRS